MKIPAWKQYRHIISLWVIFLDYSLQGREPPPFALHWSTVPTVRHRIRSPYCFKKLVQKPPIVLKIFFHSHWVVFAPLVWTLIEYANRTTLVASQARISARPLSFETSRSKRPSRASFSKIALPWSVVADNLCRQLTLPHGTDVFQWSSSLSVRQWLAVEWLANDVEWTWSPTRTWNSGMPCLARQGRKRRRK